MKKVLLSEDVSEDVIQSYIDRGFKPHFLSKRKIKKKDKRVYNKIQRVNLDPALDLKFGDVKHLNDKYEYDVIDISGDPILDMLSVMGKEMNGESLASTPVSSMEEAIKFSNDFVKDVQMKFITVRTYFRYGLKTDVPPAQSGSRDFCSKLMQTPTKLYTLEEIQKLPTSHLTDMGLPADVLAYKGGFYHNPDTGITTPDCRHTWYAEVRVEK